MRGLGWVAAGLIVVVGVGAIVIGVRSIPDMRRYAKIRQM